MLSIGDNVIGLYVTCVNVIGLRLFGGHVIGVNVLNITGVISTDAKCYRCQCYRIDSTSEAGHSSERKKRRPRRAAGGTQQLLHVLRLHQRVQESL